MSVFDINARISNIKCKINIEKESNLVYKISYCTYENIRAMSKNILDNLLCV